jgi:hypothetical protein
LGVPVSFSEISKISVLMELSYEGGNLMPELSFGTHFFQDLVESDIFYAALFPQKQGVVFNKNLLEMDNSLSNIIPSEAEYENVVKVFDFDPGSLKIMSDIVSQKLICFFK